MEVGSWMMEDGSWKMGAGSFLKNSYTFKLITNQ